MYFWTKILNNVGSDRLGSPAADQAVADAASEWSSDSEARRRKSGEMLRGGEEVAERSGEEVPWDAAEGFGIGESPFVALRRSREVAEASRGGSVRTLRRAGEAARSLRPVV